MANTRQRFHVLGEATVSTAAFSRMKRYETSCLFCKQDLPRESAGLDSLRARCSNILDGKAGQAANESVLEGLVRVRKDFLDHRHGNPCLR